MKKTIDAAKVFSSAENKLRARTNRSAAMFERALQLIPSGVTSNARYSEPYPIFVREARGAKIWDLDGNEYIDCRLGFGPIVLGHSPEVITSAVTRALMGGSVYALPHQGEVELAERICAAVPGSEMATFCSSGSEATLHALRLSRAYTGKKKIAKFEGGYHGIHDTVLASFQYQADVAGPVERPVPVVESPGIPDEALANTVILPFNHPAAIDMISDKASELAAVIIEPVQGAAGGIPATPRFLQALRNVTARHGIILIFDEIITGFRLALGGAQEYYAVRADLMTYGKILGGGFPFGCLAGLRDIMRSISVPEARKRGRTPVMFGGTFNGCPTSVAAANATLAFLSEHRDIYARMNEDGQRIRREVADAAAARGLTLTALGEGSLFSFRFVESPVTSVRDLAGEDPVLPQALYLCQLTQGVLTHPRHSFLCAAHGDEEIKRVIAGYQSALDELAAASQ